jgi:purine-binding chemotaxis protein CheW
MKTFHHVSSDESAHFLVEQEVAIDDYLAGLLKDFTEPSESALYEARPAPPMDHRNGKMAPISLTIVSRASLVQNDLDAEVESFDISGPWSEDRIDTAVGPLDLDLPQRDASQSVEMSFEASVTLPEQGAWEEATETGSFVAKADDYPAETVSESAAYAVDAVATEALDDESSDYLDQQQDTLGEIAPESSAVDASWQIFSVGAAKVGLPTAEIYAVVPSVTIEPLKGAPSHVAGSIIHQGRRRMVLSLSSWFPGGGVSNASAQVVLLGADGLWGVHVGTAQIGTVWDESQTNWRTVVEREGARPWLAGVNRSAGLAFLAVAALRAALKAPRSGS